MHIGLMMALTTGLVAELVLLAMLGGTAGLGGPGWLAGMASAVVVNIALVRGLARSGALAPTPGDWLTLLRATLVGGVTALIADGFYRPAPVLTLVSLATVALVLDAVDGWVARRTQSATRLGSRFDMEVDAWLILVLSVYVASRVGSWVLIIGAARYAFVAAGWLLPWLRASARPRYWNKVVAALQGIALTVVAADVVPLIIAEALLVIAAALLAESFGREALWLWRHRQVDHGARPVAQTPIMFRSASANVLANSLAGLLVWFALVVSNQINELVPAAFVKIPAAGLLIVALALVLPPLARRRAAVVSGVFLSLFLLLKIVDMGFFAALDRSFDPLNDWSYFASGVDLLSDTIGPVEALFIVAAAALLIGVVIIVMPWATARLLRAAAGHRRRSLRAVAALGVIWIVCAVAGVEGGTNGPVASTSATPLVDDRFDPLPRAWEIPQRGDSPHPIESANCQKSPQPGLRLAQAICPRELHPRT